MSAKPKSWRNRIVGHGEEAPDQILANEKNWRIHPKPQQDALDGELAEIGWVQECIINKRTAEAWGRDQGVETLVDGHLRVALAISRGEKMVPVLYVDLSPAEEGRVLATLDPLAGMAVMDKTKMAELLAEVGVSNDLLASLAAEAGMPDFQAASAEVAIGGRKPVTCPECGYEFTPGGKA